MGGTQSSRKITVDNENSIHVTKEAIDRLQTQLNNAPSKTNQFPPNPSQPSIKLLSPPSQPAIIKPHASPPQIPEDEKKLSPAAAPAPAPPAAPVQYPFPEYLESKRSAYADEEAYWSKRIENLKRKHESINAGLKAEYQRTLKQATDLFETVHKDEAMKMPPCQNEVTKILNCYKSNAGKTLACSQAVSSFMECVSASKSKNVA